MPGFNLSGKTEVRTSFGGFLTLLAALIIFVYAVSKSTHLASVTGATVSTYDQDAEFSQENPLDLNAEKVKIAFSFRGNSD